LRVSNQSISNSVAGSEPSAELKTGETYPAVIKEKISDHEAIVQIKGKDYQVKFEDEMPLGERFNIQLTENTGGTLLVKVSSGIKNGDHIKYGEDLTNTLKQLGVTISPELKEVIKLLISHDIPLNRGLFETLQRYLSTSEATDLQKLNTITALLNKKLDFTLTNLISIDQALHGKPISEHLINIINNLHDEGKINAWIQQHHLITEGIKNYKEEIDIKEPEVKNILSFQKREPLDNHFSEEVLNGIGKGSTILIEESDENLQPKIDDDAVVKDKILHIANSVQSNLEDLTRIIQNIKELNSNEFLNDSYNFLSKEFIVTEVTKKLAEVTQQFNILQRDVSRNLDNISHTISQIRGTAQIKPLLENTIDLIDKAILKSEITLFTDMKTEKALLQASSQLADARRLLSKGDSVGARRIVEEVNTIIKNIKFQPSDVKIMHFLSREIFAISPISKERMIDQYLYELSSIKNLEPSAKHTYNLIRSLGLNYDSEVAQALSSSPDQLNQEEIQRNMKAVILNLLKGEMEHNQRSKLHPDMEQLLSNITGQQLLSKSDTGNIQSMFFNIPLILGKQVENIRVYINSKKDGQKIDWENCSLYFLIETKKMGETGVLLNSTDRNLSITLKNDRPDFKSKLEPLVNKYKIKLQDIGYNISSITYAKLTVETAEKTLRDESISMYQVQIHKGSKGFDYKV
jgi:hypothetical protein